MTDGSPDTPRTAPDGGTTVEPPSDGLLDSKGARDALLVLGLMAGLYVLFALISMGQGNDFNGLVNTLQRITFLSAVYAMLVLALNLHWGYTGLFNIGIAGFMMVGVYTFGIITGSPEATGTTGAPGLGLPIWAGFIGGALMAGFFGFLAALPALRLDADYLAIVTIGFSEMIRLTINSTTLQTLEIGGIEIGTGGASGIIFPGPDLLVRGLLFANPATNSNPTALGDFWFGIGTAAGIEDSVMLGWAYAIFLVLVVGLFYAILIRTGNSPFGRVLKAIREDEIVANSLGKDTNRFKIVAFVVGCALMGIGGILWRGAGGSTTPTSFLPIATFYIFIALIIGGSGSNTGSVIGGAVFASLLFQGPPAIAGLVDNALQGVIDATPTTFVDALAIGPGGFVVYMLDNISSLRFVLLGVVLILVMIYRPDGLLGHRKETAASVDLSVRPDGEGGTGGGRPAADGGETDE
ncbi:branched-chain amino acid ABC transporter permease [Haloglomus litoreum]|uniref:branched-chain amino acid ABC transporter permease n=1 Tax=Haloglomus litoreum TaxID=3034026 RepID=UPI0023E8F0C5|nr:branched-chain amino acid ABC transporter permease [Haloglomus sp. DT116]